jgi:hypothetical protein
MYLSDLLVVAMKTGGEDRVEALFDILSNMPSDWWEFRGCSNWLVAAARQYQSNKEKFLMDLAGYAKSERWTSGKPFIVTEKA